MTRLPIRHRLGSFVEELRRRRVFRVLIAYAVVGVGVAEGADIFFPALGFPGWTVSLVALLVLLGLPVALGLAWAFDVVPDAGVDKATDPARGHRERVEDLFVDALEVEPSRRDAFLEAGASGDPALLAEVRSLLAAHERQGPLDESRALVPPSVADAGGAGPAMVGRRVFHYEILEHLGGGGMGVVYKARDTRLGRVVALKFLSAHLLASAEAKERFMVEAQAAAALDHPNLCTIYEVGETAHGELYIAMAFYEGETLQRRLGRGPISQDEALNIAAQTGRGLARAAEQGIIHRDIKPANLIITPDGTVKIVDFGLAKMVGGDLTQTGTRMGTIAYMSPEQTMGDPVDQRTDVWSVGVVLYEMLTGARPFTGGNEQAVIHAILNLEPLPLDRAAPHVSPGVAAVVDRAIEKDLNRRYPDAAGLLADIERLLSDPTSRSPLDSTPSLPPEGERRRITVLVCSITGFETLLDSLDLAAVEHELSSLRALVQNVVEDYGGVLNE
jgi:serine/threonine protein kinase